GRVVFYRGGYPSYCLSHRRSACRTHQPGRGTDVGRLSAVAGAGAGAAADPCESTVANGEKRLGSGSRRYSADGRPTSLCPPVQGGAEDLRIRSGPVAKGGASSFENRLALALDAPAGAEASAVILLACCCQAPNALGVRFEASLPTAWP